MSNRWILFVVPSRSQKLVSPPRRKFPRLEEVSAVQPASSSVSPTGSSQPEPAIRQQTKEVRILNNTDDVHRVSSNARYLVHLSIRLLIRLEKTFKNSKPAVWPIMCQFGKPSLLILKLSVSHNHINNICNHINSIWLSY